MIFKSIQATPVSAFGNAHRKTLAVGERMMVAEYRLPAGAEVPVHHHHHEEAGYLVSGSLRVRIGEQEDELKQGDSWYIPAETDHSMAAADGSIFVAVFSPPRSDYRL